MATEVRRQHLRDQIRAIRAIWRGDTTFTSPTLHFDGLEAVVDWNTVPRIVVGASAWATIEVAVEEADGVNIRLGPSVPEYVRRVRELVPSTFEISVLTQQSTLAEDRVDELERVGRRPIDLRVTTLVRRGRVHRPLIRTRRSRRRRAPHPDAITVTMPTVRVAVGCTIGSPTRSGPWSAS